MVRTQIQLEKGQYDGLRKWARRLGISLSEAVRRCVAAKLAAEEASPTPDERLRDALSVIGKYADAESPSRVARDHDRHFAEVSRH
jgi:hypothetical protein